MPKKKAAKKTAKTAAKKKPAPKARKPEELEPMEEWTLDPIEEKAFKLAHSSAKVQRELELAAADALGKAVRKVFKDHKMSLTPAQSVKMAMILFGD